MTTNEMRKILLSKKGLTPVEKKEIEKANDYDIKDLFAEFKKQPNPKKYQLPNRFTDNFL